MINKSIVYFTRCFFVYQLIESLPGCLTGLLFTADKRNDSQSPDSAYPCAF